MIPVEGLAQITDRGAMDQSRGKQGLIARLRNRWLQLVEAANQADSERRPAQSEEPDKSDKSEVSDKHLRAVELLLKILYAAPFFILLCFTGIMPQRLICEGWANPFKIGIAGMIFGGAAWLGFELLHKVMLPPRPVGVPRNSRRQVRIGIYILWGGGVIFAGLFFSVMYLAVCR